MWWRLHRLPADRQPKYIFRSRHANVFNPAALAIIASFYVFHTGQSWWGALTEVPLLTQVILLLAGIFITDRVNKMPIVLVFSRDLLSPVYGDGVPGAIRAGSRRSIVRPIWKPRCSSRLSSSPIHRPRPRSIRIRLSAVFWSPSSALRFSSGRASFTICWRVCSSVMCGKAWRRVHRRSTSRFPRGTAQELISA